MTGADGGLGASVLRHLLRVLRTPHDLVLLLDRPPAGDHDHDLSRCGAQLRRVDFADAATLDAAMAGGVDVVVLVPWGPLMEQASSGQEDRHRGVIDAAARAGARHVFYASMAFGGELQAKSLARVMQPHLATEAYLASIARPALPTPSSSSSTTTTTTATSSVGLTFTVIREAIFTESYPLYLGFIDVERPPDDNDDDVLLLPTAGGDDDDGRLAAVAWASREQLGEATAQLVYSYTYEAECFPYVNEIVLMSGPVALSLADAARALGRLLGRPALRIKRAASIDDYVARYAEAASRYPDVADLRAWATVYAAIEAGECGVVTATLEDWLGRRPETFEETLSKLALAPRDRATSTGLPK